MEVAARHMAAGVMNLGELARLCEADTGKPASLGSLNVYRSNFRRHGAQWVERQREANRDSNRRIRTKDPDEGRETARRWRTGNPARQLLNQCRAHARQRDHQCTITVEMIEEMLAPMLCSATGLPLSWEWEDSATRRPWATSVDRLDNALGYVPGNVRVVCVLYNQMRSNHCDEDFMKVAKALAARAP